MYIPPWSGIQAIFMLLWKQSDIYTSIVRSVSIWKSKYLVFLCSGPLVVIGLPWQTYHKLREALPAMAGMGIST